VAKLAGGAEVEELETVKEEDCEGDDGGDVFKTCDYED
jgi:hypothetical protein